MTFELYQASSAQKRIYLLNLMQEGSILYNLPQAWVLEGNLDIARLEVALNLLVERHESLRTSFLLKDGKVLQKVFTEIKTVIYRLLPENKSIEQLMAEFTIPFDLRTPPLCRLGVVELEPGKHLLILDIHHIIADGISVGIFIYELMALYAGEDLPPVEFQYVDFTMWQNQAFESEYMQEQESYWLNIYKGDIPVLNLPVDSPRISTSEADANTLGFEVDKEITDRLKQIANENKTTLYAVLLGIYGLLLSNYSGQDDIVIGSQVTGRSHQEFQQIIGIFVNMLAFRIHPYPSTTFKDYLKSVSDHVLTAFDNQDYPFELLVEKMNPERDLNRNPLTDIMFIFQNFENSKEIPGGFTITPHYGIASRAKFDLLLTAHEDEQRIVFDLNYRTTIFKEATIRRMVSHFKNIISHVGENPGIFLSAVDMLSGEEKQHLIEEFNETHEAFSEYKMLHNLFEEQVKRTPERIGIVGESLNPLNSLPIQLTYAEVNRQAERVAYELHKKGIERETVVGIMVERSVEMMIGILGILKAGGVYLPITPGYPKERIDFIVKDSDAAYVLSQQDFVEYSRHISTMPGDLTSREHHSKVNTIDSDMCYIIYTSGSTGIPKGVVVEHASAINLIQAMQSRYPLKEGDTYLLKTSFMFDVSVAELFGWSIGGGRLAVLAGGGEKDPLMIIKSIARNRVTHINFVPSMFNVFLEYVTPEVKMGLSCLKYIFLAGEALLGELVERSREIGLTCNLENLYGPTEGTVYSSWYSLSEWDGRGPIPIGKPVSNVKLYILGIGNKVQPIGITGELCIGGSGLARGYLKRDELNREKFFENPFISGGRLYRSGDNARWMNNGNIEYLGRIDSQVKIRGFRIELGEIENRLLAHDRIKEAAVLVTESETGDKSIVAYVVAVTEFSEDELRTFLLNDLPDYMIPSCFISLKEMPLTSSGKLNRKMLPAPNLKTQNEYIAPENEVEWKLTEIWSDILERDNTSISAIDNFFHIGGHSLKATVLCGRIQKEFNVSIPLSKVFAMPTIRSLRRFIDEQQKVAYHSVEKIEAKEYYLLSSAQRRLYILHRITESGFAYNMPSILLIEGEVDKLRMEEAFKKLIQRHESLRTAFETIENEPRQRIYPHVDFSLEYDIPEDRFVRSFDLSKPPLFRSCLTEIQENRYLLMIDIHHIISDGVSIRVLMDDFSELYSGKELPGLNLQYKDFTEWQLREKNNIFVQGEYWKQEFSGEIPVLELPADYVRPALQSFKGCTIEFELNEELTGRLRNLSAQNQTTLFILLLSIYNVFLSKITNQEDIVVGTPVAGRRHPDLERIIGVFINTLALRNFPVGEKRFIDFLGEVKAKTLNALENQDYPYEELVESISVPRNTSRNPLFDSMFVFQDFNPQDINLKDLKTSPYSFDSQISKFDLLLNAYEDGERIHFDLNYCTALFKEETIIRLNNYFMSTVSGICENPGQPLSEIGIMSADERSQLVFDFNDTHAEYPGEKNIHTFLEEQAERRPDSVSIAYESSQITYRELNEKADSLALALIANGIVQDTIVSIKMERSIEIIIGIFGILKAGGAYLPVDPEYPSDRVDFMLKDSNAQLVLTIPGMQDLVMNRNTGPLKLKRSNSHSKISLAYIIYTSGTTGKPKGVMIDHYNVVRLLFNEKFQFDFNIEDKWTVFHSFCFDFSVWEMYGALLYGGKAIIIPRAVAIDTQRFLGLLINENVTVLNQTPSAFYNLMNLELVESHQALRLRYVIFGGEALNPKMLREWRTVYPGTQLINMYGITETTVHVTYKEITEIEMESPASKIGKPIPTLTAYVLDRSLGILPIGVAGELCVGGKGVGRGYLNRPELTAVKFIINPYLNGEILYRSGDLAKRDLYGNLEYMGRIDQQVKVRGFRIELGEIESRLIGFPGIKDAVVTHKKDDKGDNYLCAYFVSSAVISSAGLREHLSRYLPEYMVPAYFVQLDRIPLNSNGKIDRRALPEPGIIKGESYVAPTTATEQELAQIWSDVLGLEKESVGIEDNFFHIGGHSLNAISVVNKIHKAFGVKIGIQELFQHPTISGLSRLIDASTFTLYEEIEKLPVQPYYELSYPQKRMWFIIKRDSSSAMFNMPAQVILNEPVKPGLVEDSLRVLMERHESLRTSFKEIDGEAVSIVWPADYVRFKMEYIDLCPCDDPMIARYRDQFMAEESEYIFNLETVPLFKAKLIKFQENFYDLVFNMHHIVSDGWSIEILKEEFLNIFNTKKNGAAIDLEPVKVQYKDFAAWQNNLLLDKSKIEKAKAFWMDYLKGPLPVLDLPYDFSSDSSREHASAGYRFVIPGDISERLRTIGKENQASLFMVLLAGFNLSLSHISNQRDILLAMPAAAREHEELHRIVGLFVNTLLLRNTILSEETFIDFFKRSQENMMNVLEFQGFPLELICSELKMKYPDISVFFNMVNIGTGHLDDLEDIQNYHIEKVQDTKFDLVCYLYEYKNAIEIYCHYQMNRFKPQTIEKIMTLYSNLLGKVSNDPFKNVKEYVLTEKRGKLKRQN